MHSITGAGFSVHYDITNHIVYAAYDTVITADATIGMYRSRMKLYLDIGIKNIYGSIMDFTQVERFAQGSLGAVQQESYHFHTSLDLSRIPVAVIVSNSLQKQIVGFSIKLTRNRQCKRIVHSLEEAKIYFREWHHQAQS